MAMVIDDRLLVWEKTDQPRVHEVQAYMPYTDPKAEVRLSSLHLQHEVTMSFLLAWSRLLSLRTKYEFDMVLLTR